MANPFLDILRALGLWRPKVGDDNIVKTDISLAVGDPNGPIASAIRSRSKILGKSLSYEFRGVNSLRRNGTNNFVESVHDLV